MAPREKDSFLISAFHMNLALLHSFQTLVFVQCPS